MTSPKYLHVCEACGVEATLTPDGAYNAGWDYPPRMGEQATLARVQGEPESLLVR